MSISKLEEKLSELRREASEAAGALSDAAFLLAEGRPIDPLIPEVAAGIGARIKALRAEIKEYADARALANGRDLEEFSFSDLSEFLTHCAEVEHARASLAQRLDLLRRLEVDVADSPSELVAQAEKIKQEAARLLEAGRDAWEDHPPLINLLSYLEAYEAKDYKKLDNLETLVDKEQGPAFRRWATFRLHLPRKSTAPTPAAGEAASAPAAPVSVPAEEPSAEVHDSHPPAAAKLATPEPATPELLAPKSDDLEAYATKLVSDAEQRVSAQEPIELPPVLDLDVAVDEPLLGEATKFRNTARAVISAPEGETAELNLRTLCFDLWRTAHLEFAWVVGTGQHPYGSRNPAPRLLRAATLTNCEPGLDEEIAKLISDDCQWLRDHYVEVEKMPASHLWVLGVAMRPALFGGDYGAQYLLWRVATSEQAPQSIKEIAKLVADFSSKRSKPLDPRQVAIAKNSANSDAAAAALGERAAKFMKDAENRDRKTFSAVKVWKTLCQNRPTRVGLVQALLEPLRAKSSDSRVLKAALQRVHTHAAIEHEIGLVESEVTEAGNYTIHIQRGSPAYKGLVRDIEQARYLASQWLDVLGGAVAPEQEEADSISLLGQRFAGLFEQCGEALALATTSSVETLGCEVAQSTLSSLRDLFQGELVQWVSVDALRQQIEEDSYKVAGLHPEAWMRPASREEAQTVIEFLERSPSLGACASELAAAEEFEKLDWLAASVSDRKPAAAAAIEAFTKRAIAHHWKALGRRLLRTALLLDRNTENALTPVEKAFSLKAELDFIRELDSVQKNLPPGLTRAGLEARNSGEFAPPEPGLFGAVLKALDEVDQALESDRLRFAEGARKSIEPPSEASPNLRAAFDKLIGLGEFSKALLLRERIMVGTPTLALDTELLNQFFPAVVRAAEKAENRLLEVEELQRIGAIDGPGTGAIAEVPRQVSHWKRLRDAVQTQAALTGPQAAEDLKGLLEFIGFKDVKLAGKFDTDPIARRAETEIEFTPRSDREFCPLPAFGSQSHGRLRLVLLSQKRNPLELPSLVGRSSLPTLVLVFQVVGYEDRLKLAETCLAGQEEFLVVDNPLFVHLLGVDKPALRSRTFFECAAPFSYAQPYVSSGGSLPPEMFFGRKSQKNGLQQQKAPYLVYGGRQLGKTALLREVEREFNKDSRQKAAWIDLDYYGLGKSQPIEHFWTVLAQRLVKDGVLMPSQEVPADDPDPDALCDEIEGWLNKTVGSRVLLLLDEADAVLEEDAQERLRPNGRTERYPLTQKLASLQAKTENRFKIVFAGLRNVQRFASHENHPVGRLGQALSIGPFTAISDLWNDQQEELLAAQSLILEPLRCLGIKFESESVLQSVLWATNFYPSFAQIVGESVVNWCTRANERQRPVTLTEAALRSILTSTPVRSQFEDRLKLTLGLDGRFAVVVYSIAKLTHEAPEQHSFSGFSRESIEETAKFYAGSLFPDGAFTRLFDEMVEMGMLRSDEVAETGRLRSENARYDLRSPMLLQMLGDYRNIVNQLQREWEPAPRYNAATHRSPIPNSMGQEISPFTDAQFQFIVGPIKTDPGNKQVSVCFGSEASGLDRVAACLESNLMNKKRLWACRPEQTSLDQWKVELSEQIKDREQRRTFVVLVDARCGWGLRWLQHALTRPYGYPVHFVFMADPAKALEMDALPQGVGTISLGPWHDFVLRRWLHENRREDFPSARRKFAERVSLWPGMLSRFRTFAAGCLEGPEPDTEGFAEQWRKSPLEFLRLFGIEPDRQSILKCLQNLRTGPSSLGDLVAVTGLEMEAPLRWAERLRIANKTGEKYELDSFVGQLLDAAPELQG